MLPILAALALGASPEPPLACPTPLADRGEVRTGPPLSHTFRLTNPGSHAVTLQLAPPGCGCVRQALAADRLGPGESADLLLSVNTLTPPPGPNSWAVVVHAAPDGGDPTPVTLTLKATLVREVTVSPAAVAFSASGEARQTVTVSDRRPKPLAVRAASTTAPFLTASVVPGGVEVVLSADAPAGEHHETLTVLTDDPACPELRVPVRVSKRTADGVTATPDAVTLRFADGQPALSGLVQLRAGGKPLAVRQATADSPAVTVAASAYGPAATVRVTVNRAAAAGQNGRATVRVELSEPPGRVVTVPVAWEFP